jgi:acetoacetyl-CoA synthetase
MQYFPIIYEGDISCAVDESASITDLPRWFEGTRLNFAENVLYARDNDQPDKRCVMGKEDDKTAVVEMREGGEGRRQETWGELRASVAMLAHALTEAGLQASDVVAAVASSNCDTLKVFLASTALGAVFTTSSPEMGVKVRSLTSYT